MASLAELVARITGERARRAAEFPCGRCAGAFQHQRGCPERFAIGSVARRQAEERAAFGPYGPGVPAPAEPPSPSHNELTDNEAIKALLEHGCAGPSALYAKLKKAGVVLARRTA